MITPKNILDAAEALLTAAFPGEAVIRSYLPKSFSRPSNFIEFVSRQVSDADRWSFDVVAVFTVTTFSATDDYYNSDTDTIMTRGLAVEQLFGGISMTVGDRALRIDKIYTEYGLDYAVTAVTLHWQDDRTQETEITDKMQNVYLTENYNTED